MNVDTYKSVRTAAIFENGDLRPVWFCFNSCKIEIKEICYKWMERIAGSSIYKFTVYDGTDYFELAFSTNDMCWRICGVTG